MSLIPAFASDMRGSLAPTTLSAYVRVLGKHEPLPLTLDQCREWKARRLTEVTPATVCAELRALKSFDRWHAEEMGTTPVLTRVPLPKVTVNDHAPVVTEEEYLGMLARCGADSMGLRDAAIVALLWSTGARLSEVARLTVDDVDLELGTVTITEAKNGHARVAYLDREPRKRVRRYLSAQGHAEGPLWVGQRGKAVTKALLEDALHRRSGGAVSAHMFRRALAQRWLSSGGSETLLCAVAGWRSPRMVGVYVRAVKTELALGEAARLFG